MEKNFINLKSADGLEVSLTPLGASIYNISYGKECMTLTPKNFQQFADSHFYYGKTIGPIANRVKDGVLSFANQKYFYDINEGQNSLHSGLKGISNKMFDYRTDNDRVVFLLDDEKVKYEIIYQIHDNSLKIFLNATAKEDLPISLTNHAYFCLGDQNITNLSLTIPSHGFVETDTKTLLPIKERNLLPCLDFNVEKKVMQDINNPYLKDHRSNGYDHCFLLNKGHIVLKNQKYEMTITTDYEALQIYSDNYEDGVEMISTKENHYRGIAMEPEDNLLNRQLLARGETYRRFIEYTFHKITPSCNQK